MEISSPFPTWAWLSHASVSQSNPSPNLRETPNDSSPGRLNSPLLTCHCPMLFIVWSLDSVVYFPVYTGVSPRAEVGQGISFEILHYTQAGALSVDTQCVVLLLGASYNKMEAENVPSAGREEHS